MTKNLTINVVKKTARILTPIAFGLGFFYPAAAQSPLAEPDEYFTLSKAPREAFNGKIFLLNDWDSTDKSSQNSIDELNRGAKIGEGLVNLSQKPGFPPRKIVRNIVVNPTVLADASMQGPVAIVLGSKASDLLVWLTAVDSSFYNYENIYVVSHDNVNEADGISSYERNARPCLTADDTACDGPLVDSYQQPLRRGLYPSLARIADLGVTIWEIPRADLGNGGWGGGVQNARGESVNFKPLDLSDFAGVHYLKTGIRSAYRFQRNQLVFNRKPKILGI